MTISSTVPAMSWCRAGSSFPQRRSFASLADVHSQEQKERASQEQPFAEHNGEISWMAHRCNNLPLRQRTFGKNPLYTFPTEVGGVESVRTKSLQLEHPKDAKRLRFGKIGVLRGPFKACSVGPGFSTAHNLSANNRTQRQMRHVTNAGSP